MSLEQALNENTAAIKALGLIMVGLSPAIIGSPDTAAASEPVVRKAESKPGAAKPAEKTEETDQPPEHPAPAATGKATETKQVTYDEAKAAVTAVVKARGRDGGLAVLAKFNTQSLLEVPEAQWADVITACNEALK
jgi:hypothetical protein